MGHFYRGTHKKQIPYYSVASSIPTKYQRLVITNHEPVGFSTQSKKFTSQLLLNETPGPGSYDCITSTELQSPSFSTKGTTGFVPSKAPRASSYPQRGVPGPNVYNLQRSFTDKCDFSVGASRVFRLPVGVQLDSPKHITPAPNQYDVCYSNRSAWRFSSVGTSAFLSKTGRNSFHGDSSLPSPCHYNVNNNNNNNVRCVSKAVVSPFRSKTERIPAPVDQHVPGPGAYSPHLAPAPVKRTILQYFPTMSAPPLSIPKNPPLPGPGQYDIGVDKSLHKYSMPSAAFASKTARIPQSSLVDTGPGPGFYNPQTLPKQSFICNDSGLWIPV
ncbi:O(6)-methylguanine-induced apoptosis 2 isoform X2 [Nelusetta ayraudi]|uniref:O(6)-methylguanine-induced apoptosis 2 isoform X2 n=1 Tax=Nelusetta ayraudi TaxID=303726 RepID=UPI003F6EBD1A